MAPHVRSHVRAPLFWFNSRFDAAQLDVIVLQLGCVHAAHLVNGANAHIYRRLAQLVETGA